MTRSALKLALATGLIALAGCDRNEQAANDSAAQKTSQVGRGEHEAVGDPALVFRQQVDRQRVDRDVL